jgi:hypothetical protein
MFMKVYEDEAGSNPFSTIQTRSEREPIVQQKGLSTKQTAAYLGKTVKAIEGLRARGILHPKKLGRRLLYSLAEIDRFLLGS